MNPGIKVLAVVFLICVVGHVMFWMAFFIDKVAPLWLLYGLFGVLTVLSLGGFLFAVLTE